MGETIDVIADMKRACRAGARWHAFIALRNDSLDQRLEEIPRYMSAAEGLLDAEAAEGNNVSGRIEEEHRYLQLAFRIESEAIKRVRHQGAFNYERSPPAVKVVRLPFGMRYVSVSERGDSYKFLFTNAVKEIAEVQGSFDVRRAYAAQMPEKFP